MHHDLFSVHRYANSSGGVYEWEDWPYCVSPQRGDGVTQCWPCMAKGYSIEDCGNHGKGAVSGARMYQCSAERKF